METCYRHPTRETGVSCSSCGRPICPDCMTPTPVGMRCPECSRERTPVKTMRSLERDPAVTYALIGVSVLAYIGSRLAAGGLGGTGGEVMINGALYGPAIAEDHEYWRLLTGGFLHAANPLHLLFNMYLLYVLGGMLEPAIGHLRFATLYFTSLLTGSFGALLLSPDKITVGASGAVFGLMGGAFIALRARGIDPMASGLGPLILLNLAITFLLPRTISVGGHVGGLLGGLIVGYILFELGARRRSPTLPLAACAAVALAAIGGSIAVAGGSGLI